LHGIGQAPRPAQVVEQPQLHTNAASYQAPPGTLPSSSPAIPAGPSGILANSNPRFGQSPTFPPPVFPPFPPNLNVNGPSVQQPNGQPAPVIVAPGPSGSPAVPQSGVQINGQTSQFFNLHPHPNIAPIAQAPVSQEPAVDSREAFSSDPGHRPSPVSTQAQSQPTHHPLPPPPPTAPAHHANGRSLTAQPMSVSPTERTRDPRLDSGYARSSSGSVSGRGHAHDREDDRDRDRDRIDRTRDFVRDKDRDRDRDRDLDWRGRDGHYSRRDSRGEEYERDHRDRDRDRDRGWRGRDYTYYHRDSRDRPRGKW